MAVLWYQLKILSLAFQRNASVIIRANVMITGEFWMLVSDLKLISENSLSIYAGTNWETSLGTRPSERGSGGWKCTVHPECRRASDWKEGLGDRLGWKYTERMYEICNYWVSELQFVFPINVLRHAIMNRFFQGSGSKTTEKPPLTDSRSWLMLCCTYTTRTCWIGLHATHNKIILCTKIAHKLNQIILQ